MSVASDREWTPRPRTRSWIGRVPGVFMGGVRRVFASVGSTRGERIAFVLTTGLVLLGLGLRARGYLYDQTGLWLDETSWAMRIFERPLVQSMIRPLGFLAVSKYLASTFSDSETVLRALPWTAGIVATLLLPRLARRLFRSPAARVLFVGIVALSPVAIDFSKEFKPYSLALALHLGLMLLVLRYVASERGRDLALALCVAAAGSFFTQDLVLAFPGLFLVMGFTALRRGRPHVVATASVAAVIIAGLALQYFLMWRNLPPDHTEFWGDKYNVFYTPDEPRSYLAWSLDRFGSLLAMPGIRRTMWGAHWLSSGARHDLRNVDYAIWILLCLAGMVTLAWQKRWREALLVVLPLFVLWCFNRAGFWPLGAFRTNVFTVAYTGALAAMAVDSPVGWGSMWRVACPVGLLVLLPLGLFEHTWGARKRTFTYDSTFPRAIELLANARPFRPGGPREVVVLDRRSCDPWRYYLTYNPRVGPRYRAEIERKYDVHCVTDDKQLPAELKRGAAISRRTWTVLHVLRPFKVMIRRGLLRGLHVVMRRDVGSHTVVALMPVPGLFRAPAQADDASAEDEAETSDPD